MKPRTHYRVETWDRFDQCWYLWNRKRTLAAALKSADEAKTEGERERVRIIEVRERLVPVERRKR